MQRLHANSSIHQYPRFRVEFFPMSDRGKRPDDARVNASARQRHALEDAVCHDDEKLVRSMADEAGHRFGEIAG